ERARVIAALRDERPTVVGAGLQDVDLVAAQGADLHLPELARLGMEAQTEAVAVPIREYLGSRAGAADKRVVFRDAAVVGQTQRLADVARQALGEDTDAVVVRGATAEVVAIADGHVWRLVRTELHAADERYARVQPRLGHVGLLGVDERGTLEAAARNRQCLARVVALEVRHVD